MKAKGDPDKYRPFEEVAEDLNEAIERLPEFKQGSTSERGNKVLQAWKEESLKLEEYIKMPSASIKDKEQKRAFKLTAARLFALLLWVIRKHTVKLTMLFEDFYKPIPEDEGEDPEQDT